MKVPKPKITIGGGVIVREYRVPKGMVLTSHIHPYDHMSILISGECSLAVDGRVSVLRGPCSVEIKAGMVHSLYAMTDCVWDCVHALELANESGDPLILEGVN